MSEGVKFSEDEIKEISELQKTYVEVQSQFGQIAIAKLNLQTQANELNKVENEYREKFVETQNTEKELVDKLTEKYGEGSLDPTTGVFTPVSK
jgi:hypothetical protein